MDTNHIQKVQNVLRSLFKSCVPSFLKVEGEGGPAWERVKRVGGDVVMPRRPVETLTDVKLRLKREQDERTQKRIAELLFEVEPESEVQELVRQSRQLLQQVEEERKATVRVSLSCCYLLYCVLCSLHCALFVQSVGGSCGAAAHKQWHGTTLSCLLSLLTTNKTACPLLLPSPRALRRRSLQKVNLAALACC